MFHRGPDGGNNVFPYDRIGAIQGLSNVEKVGD